MPKYLVRHGAMRLLGLHTTRGNDTYRRGDKVVCRTERGTEAGEVLCLATDEVARRLDKPGQGQILRLAQPDDLAEIANLRQTRHEMEICQNHVARLRLQMQLVDVERLLGGERLVVYYVAEQRVDFRQLVKDLAAELKIRIEMRQIGIRDEAKLLADYGDCGKPVCCNTHLSEMPPVSMKMAKIQKATLDPAKISGRCGRLKCCLRYEYDTYVDAQKKLPPVGSEVITREGRCKVIGHELLAEQLLVQDEESRRMLIHLGEVLSVSKRAQKGKPRREEEDEDERAE